jgi:benzoate/toluate 1,2-dioxygenase subunit beta
MIPDRNVVERFLFHEARLMDDHRYDEWLALWAVDGSLAMS